MADRRGVLIPPLFAMTREDAETILMWHRDHQWRCFAHCRGWGRSKRKKCDPLVERLTLWSERHHGD